MVEWGEGVFGVGWGGGWCLCCRQLKAINLKKQETRVRESMESTRLSSVNWSFVDYSAIYIPFLHSSI